MTEWEQIKNEYREIPVPDNGPHQMLETIAKARKARSRNRWRRVAAYGTVAAAALLVILIVPGMLLSGGFSDSSNETAGSMEAGCVMKSSASSNGAIWDVASEESITENTAAPATAYDNMKNAGAGDTTYGYEETAEKATAWDTEAISKEILRQMEERMQETGQAYYRKSEEYPEGFERIAEDQEYYINEEGLLVIVFEAGTVAPEEVGIVEFVIPAEVAAP